MSDVTTKYGTISAQEKHKREFSLSTNSEGNLDLESPDSKTAKELNKGIQVTQVQTQASTIPKDDEKTTVPLQHVTAEDRSEVFL